MKKILSTALALFLIAALSGCSKSSEKTSGTDFTDTGYTITNLDFENAEIIENMPESGKWYTLRFDYKQITKDSYNVLQEAAGYFGVSDLEKEKILCSVNYSQNEPNADIVYSEMNDEDFAITTYIRYISDDFYIDYNLSNRFEYYNRKALREILQKDYERLWSWKPGITGESTVKSYDLSKGADISDTYILNGKQTSIADALKYAEEVLNSGKMAPMTSKLLTYTPLSASVYRLSNDENAYNFDFQLNYDNVPLDASKTADAPDLDANDIFSNTFHLCMFTPESIDWIWSSPICFEAPTAQEECTIAVDFDKACKIVSEKLSQETVFKIEKAELIYYSRAVYNDSQVAPSTEFIVEPTWQFSFSSEVQEYGKLCVNVNAVTGEINLRQFV